MCKIEVEIQDDELFDDGLGDMGGDGIDDDQLSPTGSSALPSPVKRKSYVDLKKDFFRSQWNTVETSVSYGNGASEVIAHSMASIVTVDINEGDLSCSEKFMNWSENCFLSLTCSRSFKSSNVYRNTISYFNTVDKWASRLFPLMFVLFIFMYWFIYTYIL